MSIPKLKVNDVVRSAAGIRAVRMAGIPDSPLETKHISLFDSPQTIVVIGVWSVVLNSAGGSPCLTELDVLLSTPALTIHRPGEGRIYPKPEPSVEDSIVEVLRRYPFIADFEKIMTAIASELTAELDIRRKDNHE